MGKRNYDIHRQKITAPVYFLDRNNTILSKISRKAIFLDLNINTKGILDDGREVKLKEGRWVQIP